MTNSSVADEGLKVCAAAASGKNIWVKIPKAFAQNELQIDAEGIATPKNGNIYVRHFMKSVSPLMWKLVC